MPRNGAGTYTLPELPFVEGTIIDETAVNSDFSDIATALTNSLAKNGETVPTANLPMGGFKLTNLAAGSSANDSVRFEQVFTSPAFTGTPTAPTAALGTSTTQIATTAFAQTMQSPAFSGTPTAPTASPNTNTTQIATTAYVDAADALKANLASPALTGTPTAPTASYPTNTTQLATTAYVTTNFAPLASPALTGVPTAPTAAGGTNTTQIATTEFVIQQAFSTALPVQSGQAGKFLTTDGTNASWASAGSTSSAQSSGTNIALASSADTVIRITTTAANLTVTLYAATSQGGRVHVFFNAGSNAWHLYDNGANYIRTVHPGGRISIRLTDDTTAAGVWVVDDEYLTDIIRLRTATVLASLASFPSASCSLGGTKYLVAYNNGTNGVVQVVDGANPDSLTTGSAVTYNAGTGAGLVQLFSLGTDAAFLVYQDATTYSARVVTVSGTVPTLQTAATLATTASGVGCAVNVNTDVFVLFYSATANTNVSAVVITRTGNSTSFGTPTSCRTVSGAGVFRAAQAATNVAVCLYATGTSQQVSALRVTRSGTTITDDGDQDWTIDTGALSLALTSGASTCGTGIGEYAYGLNANTTTDISEFIGYDLANNRWLNMDRLQILHGNGGNQDTQFRQYDTGRLFVSVSSDVNTSLGLATRERGGNLRLSPLVFFYTNELGTWSVAPDANARKGLLAYRDNNNSSFATARIIEVGPA